MGSVVNSSCSEKKIHFIIISWAAVSDLSLINLSFAYLVMQSVYRQPKGCKERYKVLVDKNSGDGADSAEDSGSSQHYHFTLPGIPKACYNYSFDLYI